MNESWRWENIQNPDWVVQVRKIGREAQDKFWVQYVVRDKDNAPRHMDERLVRAVDELDLFRRFPAEMLKQWGTNNVRWNIDEVFKGEDTQSK